MKSYVEKYLGDTRPVPENYLEHHGVMGMKWGKRNAETLARYARDAGSRGASAVKKAIASGSKATVKALSTGAKGAARITKKVVDAARRLNTAVVTHKINKAIENGDMRQVYKYRKKMSQKSLADALTRANQYRQIKALVDPDQGTPTPKRMSNRQLKKFAKAYRKGDAKALSKYVKNLTTGELKDIQSRINYIKNLKEGKGSETSSGSGTPKASVTAEDIRTAFSNAGTPVSALKQKVQEVQVEKAKTAAAQAKEAQRDKEFWDRVASMPSTGEAARDQAYWERISDTEPVSRAETEEGRRDQEYWERIRKMKPMK
jgi:hypothetical protein